MPINRREFNSNPRVAKVYYGNFLEELKATVAEQVQRTIGKRMNGRRWDDDPTHTRKRSIDCGGIRSLIDEMKRSHTLQDIPSVSSLKKLVSHVFCMLVHECHQEGLHWEELIS